MRFNKDNLFVTSDSHYAHTNIAGPTVSKWPSGYRNFVSTREMNDVIVQSYNDVVGENDILIHGGDWSFGGEDKIEEFRRRIKCKNIYLIFGNHDHNIRRKYRHLFAGTYDLLEISVERQRIVFCHYAMRIWNKSHHGAWHLYGHSHGSLPDDPNSMSFDIGWDVWHKPLSYYEIEKEMSKKTWKQLDHHNANTTE